MRRANIINERVCLVLSRGHMAQAQRPSTGGVAPVPGSKGTAMAAWAPVPRCRRGERSMGSIIRQERLAPLSNNEEPTPTPAATDQSRPANARRRARPEARLCVGPSTRNGVRFCFENTDRPITTQMRSCSPSAAGGIAWRRKWAASQLPCLAPTHSRLLPTGAIAHFCNKFWNLSTST